MALGLAALLTAQPVFGTLNISGDNVKLRNVRQRSGVASHPRSPDNRAQAGVVGQDDTVYPVAISQALAAAIPNAKLAVLPGVAHASMFDSAEAVNKTMIAVL